jgi:hypothetical protein
MIAEPNEKVPVKVTSPDGRNQSFIEVQFEFNNDARKFSSESSRLQL